MRKNGLFLVLVPTLSITLSACSSQTPDSDGLIAEVNGQVVHLENSEKESFCSTHYCEPNYVIQSYFGRRRSPPSGNPIPVTPPSPSPTPSPTPSSVSFTPEVFDIAKTLMKTSDAWNQTLGSPEIIVAVIDSGMDITHPDLSQNLWVNPQPDPRYQDIHGFDFYENDGNPIDLNGHGTHTSGTVAAARNGFGVIGVAPNVKIMPIRFLGPEGQGSTYGAIQSIDYAVRMGATVISASWGGTGYSSLLAQAVQRAVDAGVVFVAAAGNEGRNITYTPTYPAGFPGVISVAASTDQDQIASFSNYGNAIVTVAAPGVNILSTYLNHGYERLSGTSMATPQVAGAIALALSKNKSVLPSVIQSTLCLSSDPIPGNKVKCGRINVGRFIESI